MRYTILACLALLPTTAVADGADRPISWSPDGKWLAYTVQAGRPGAILEPGWIFGPAASPAESNNNAGAEVEAGPAWQLWASRADGGPSIRIDEARGFLLAPSWSPDGRAVAYGRRADDGRTLEVVAWEGPSRRRVVASRPLPDSTVELDRLAADGVSWSPDGRYLAVPQGVPAGLAILRAEDGRQVNAVPGGRLAAWSPEGGQLACFVPGGDGESLAHLESALAPPRTLIEVGKGTRPPAWTRDGIMTLIHGPRPVPGTRRLGRAVAPVDLVRVRVDSGQAELVQSLAPEAGIPTTRDVEGVSFAIDRDGDDLFWSTVLKGRDQHVAWFRPREGVLRNRLAVLDPTLAIGSIALSPLGDALAVRLGPADRPSPPLLFAYDARDQKLRAVVPDDDARAAWLALLIESARSALVARPATGPAIARPTLLPIPGELEPTGELPQRIRRVARLGRTLCDRRADSPAADPALAALIDEARLFFDALREDYPAAQAALDTFEPRADTPGRRLALLGLRAQLALGRDQFDRADRMIAYLRSAGPRPASRLEWTGAGPVLTAEDRPTPGWVDALASRSALLRDLARATPGPTPAAEVHFNPDAMPGQGLDPFLPGPAEARFGLPDGPMFIQPPPRVPAQPPGAAGPARRRAPGAFPPPAPLP